MTTRDDVTMKNTELDALRVEFADYCIHMEPSIKDRLPRASQLEVLCVIAMSLFRACKELKSEKSALANQAKASRALALEEAAKVVDAFAEYAWEEHYYPGVVGDFKSLADDIRELAKAEGGNT